MYMMMTRYSMSVDEMIGDERYLGQHMDLKMLVYGDWV